MFALASEECALVYGYGFWGLGEFGGGLELFNRYR